MSLKFHSKLFSDFFTCLWLLVYLCVDLDMRGIFVQKILALLEHYLKIKLLLVLFPLCVLKI